MIQENSDLRNLPADLVEARRIVEELAGRLDSLSRCDRRFVRSWRQALERRGAEMPIGPHRLTHLRRCHAIYFPADGELQAA